MGHESKMAVQKINVLEDMDGQIEANPGGMYHGDQPVLDKDEELPKVPVIIKNPAHQAPDFVKIKGIGKKTEGNVKDIKHRI